MIETLGPSFAHGRGAFKEHFGDEVDVLVPTQDFLIGLFDAQPWQEYALPRDVARETRKFWTVRLADQGST